MSEEMAVVEKSERQSIDTALTTSGGLIPKNLDQLWRLATLMAKSGMMPKGIQTPEAVCVAVQMGLEVGLSPMQAVQNIAVINGRPSVWGDAGLAMVEASGKLEDFKETISDAGGVISATCWAKRKGRPTPVERTFSFKDAERAGLTSKDIWRQYPKRMTQMRARWWVIRDLFPDVLKGLKGAEEVVDYQDYIDVTPEPKTSKKPNGDTSAYQTLTETTRINDDPQQTFREEFINLRSAGFSTWVYKNKAKIFAAATDYPEAYKEAKEKWAKFYPEASWPIEQPGPTTVPASEAGLTLKVEIDYDSELVSDDVFVRSVTELLAGVPQPEAEAILSDYAVISDCPRGARNKLVKNIKSLDGLPV